MTKIQFCFGNTKENTGMKQAKTIYSSEINGQAKQGGAAATSRDVSTKMMRSNITIGTNANKTNTSEAKT